ncbi:hypothetical protein [Streptomyces sp. NPDC048442]|uniref:hypothetical protein n=1 Tax=Streptomyces sp. NPDC048442 TaxID=3154823 RepID=UPI00342E1E3A
MEKTNDQKRTDSIWGIVTLPLLAGWITFHMLPHNTAPGWILYATGVAATVLAHGWFAARKTSPGVGGVVVPLLHVLLGALFWLTRT